MGLHAITGTNRYCGPAVVSAITGKSTDDVSRIIRTEFNRPYVKGTTWWQLEFVLGQLGWRGSTGRYLGDRPTLLQWAKSAASGTYIINVPGHWIVLRKAGTRVTVADSMNRLPKPIKSFFGKSKHVLRYHQVARGVTAPPKPKTKPSPPKPIGPKGPVRVGAWVQVSPTAKSPVRGQVGRVLRLREDGPKPDAMVQIGEVVKRLRVTNLVAT